MTVEVFTRPNCNSCEAVKRYLSNKGIPFTVQRLTLDIAHEFKSQGHLTAPIVNYKGRVHSGFRIAELQKIATEFESTQRLPDAGDEEP